MFAFARLRKSVRNALGRAAACARAGLRCAVVGLGRAAARMQLIPAAVPVQAARSSSPRRQWRERLAPLTLAAAIALGLAALVADDAQAQTSCTGGKTAITISAREVCVTPAVAANVDECKNHAWDADSPGLDIIRQWVNAEEVGVYLNLLAPDNDAVHMALKTEFEQLLLAWHGDSADYSQLLENFETAVANADNANSGSLNKDTFGSLLCTASNALLGLSVCTSTFVALPERIPALPQNDYRCEIPVANHAVATVVAEHAGCFLSGTFEPQCAAVFGVSLNFPPQSAHVAGDHYVYNCAGGQLPAGVNSGGAEAETACSCPNPAQQSVQNGECLCTNTALFVNPENQQCVRAAQCPDGHVTHQGRCKTPAQKCTDADWTLSQDGTFCEINHQPGNASNPRSGCILPDPSSTGTTNLCVDAFGPNLDWPDKVGNAEPTFFHNCDPTGATGMVPAGFADGTTTGCSCSDGTRVTVETRPGYCVPPDGVTKCEIQGWTAAALTLNNGGYACHGRLGNDRDNRSIGEALLAPEGGATYDGGYCYMSGSNDDQCRMDAQENLTDFRVRCPRDDSFWRAAAGNGGACVSEADCNTAGEATLGDTLCASGSDKCKLRGWNDVNGRCSASIIEAGNPGAVATTCGFSSTPLCATVFGPNFDFPENPEDGTTGVAGGAPYVFNCDPGKANGMIPGVRNSGETSCGCADEARVIVGETGDPAGLGYCVEQAGLDACEAEHGTREGDAHGARAGSYACFIEYEARGGNVTHCFLSGAQAPQCLDDFPNYNFARTCPGADDPDGQRAATHPYFGGYCECKRRGHYEQRAGPNAGQCAAGDTETGCLGTAVPYQGRCVTPTEKCRFYGWLPSGNSCQIDVGGAPTTCLLSALQGSSTPLCTEVFGARLDFPVNPADLHDAHATAVVEYAYGCLGGEMPSGVNTNGLEECCDPNDNYIVGGDDLGRRTLCIRQEDTTDGELGTDALTEPALCLGFGGTMQETAGGNWVCSGLDAADTFCIVDAATTADGAFACRGLFKHVRDCNLKFNKPRGRPALNPFLCAPACPPNSKALGGDCKCDAGFEKQGAACVRAP